MQAPETTDCELTVIGTGMAGMAAALFAANRGLSTVQVGHSGGILFASGLLDLMGVHPVAAQKVWQDPWAAIDALVRDEPHHPYARIKKEDIRAAFDELLGFLNEAGLGYRRNGERNTQVLTSLGTVKPTYAVPETMWTGAQAFANKIPCLLVDFQGMREYSARQMAAIQKERWPALQTLRVVFPDTENVAEVYTGLMAQALESPATRKKLVERVRPHAQGVEAVGLPAIFGLYRTREILADLTNGIGVPVFEIPTLPVSVPGLRLKETFEFKLPAKGIRALRQQQVLEARPSSQGGFRLGIGDKAIEHYLHTRSIILASGRFLGKGLLAERKRIRETIFDLPVSQPVSRSGWHQKSFLDPRGHAFNRAGLEVDHCFRPLDAGGRPAFPALFAAGSILAHQDWVRMKCGSGVAIATAYAAVRACLEQK
ncbi:MAG: glycerol-3-phosphate dehydrogenase subunit GlpB [Desulfobacterales bacterium]|nr:MAG: glycerol-3-phosphate dehydrogenase subunit GlpB [Desulfobacterales bacterium]